MNDKHGRPTAQWRPRRGLAWCIRVSTVVVPFLAATVVMVVVAHLVHRPAADVGKLAWYVLLLSVSWLVARLTGRLLDRSLPLAALLEMSLTFPESAPSRLGMAQRGSSRTELAKLAVVPLDESAQDAAERILRLLTALTVHDRFTRGHAERVRAYADLIAEKLELPEADRDRLRWAALLHDIGKLRVPSQLLNKPEKPTPAEWTVLQNHPAAGSVIAAPLLGWLAPMDRVIIEHHERWDGSGYPTGLAGEQISFGARIVCVADSFEAMTAVRPYSRPMKREVALRELVNCAGSHFDPAVVRALLAVPERRLAWAMGPAAWLTGLPMLGQTSLNALRTAAGHATTFTAGATVVVAAAAAPASLLGQPASADVSVLPRTAVAARTVHTATPTPTTTPSPATSSDPATATAPVATAPTANPAVAPTPDGAPPAPAPKPAGKPVKKPVGKPQHKPKPPAKKPTAAKTAPVPPAPATPGPTTAPPGPPAAPPVVPPPTPPAPAKPGKHPKPTKPTKPGKQPAPPPKATPPSPAPPPPPAPAPAPKPTPPPPAAKPTPPPPPAAKPTPPPPAQTTLCSASYVVTAGQHGNGDSFSAVVTVQSTGTAPTHGWTVSWTFAGKEQVQSYDGARVSQSGQSATATNLGYDGALPPGTSARFYLQGKRNGGIDQPTLSCLAT